MLTWKLAYRYLRGKRTANAAPILSRISMIAIAVSSAAMIIVFSVLNGFISLSKEQYNAFSPDLKISPAKGKFFRLDSAHINSIRQLAGPENVTTVIEDNVFANNFDQQKIITLKGITNDYFNVNNITEFIDGDTVVSTGGINTAIAGRQILEDLGADRNALSYILLYYGNPNATNPTADPLSAFQSQRLHPAGSFEVGDEFDGKYVLAPLALAQTLFKQEGNYSSIEIAADPDNIEPMQRQMKQLLGNDYKVETRFEQNKVFFTVMSGEKWAIYAILILVLIIASFNMIGALSMLVLEKQKDIAILRAMGIQQSAVRGIFLLEGIMWSLLGGLFGLSLGTAICLVQKKFELIKLNNRLVGAFPVELRVADFALVIGTIAAVGLLTSWYPAMRATKAVDPSLKST